MDAPELRSSHESSNLRYEDQFTGTVIDRPELSRLLRDAKLGRFDVLLVYRLARSIRGRFTRHRYGTEYCANDRLPAEKLEQAITRRLWKVLNDSDLLADAIDHA